MKGRTRILGFDLMTWMCLLVVGYVLFSGGFFKPFFTAPATNTSTPEIKPQVITPPAVTTDSVFWELLFYSVMVILAVVLLFSLDYYKKIKIIKKL